MSPETSKICNIIEEHTFGSGAFLIPGFPDSSEEKSFWIRIQVGIRLSLNNNIETVPVDFSGLGCGGKEAGWVFEDLNGIGADFLSDDGVVNLSVAELPFNFSRLELVELTFDSSDFRWVLLLGCLAPGGRVGFLVLIWKI